MPDTLSDPPRPEGLTTPAEFVAALAALRGWSGLTYRQLTAKARASGDVLPSSTIAGALSRRSLPRAELVAAFVRACGLDDNTTQGWLAVRQRLAAATAAPGPATGAAIGSDIGSDTPVPGAESTMATTADEAPGPVRPGHRRGSTIAATLLLVALVIIALVLADGRRPGELADGWYRIKPAHIEDHGLCLGEGRERNRRTDRPLVVQRPCAGAVPETYLRRVGEGVYEIQWHDPVSGTGCLTVDEALVGDGALVAPADCVGAAHQQFLLETVDTPVHGAFRLRPVHSGLCIGILGGPADIDAGAEAVQTHCTAAADQQFLIQPAPRAGR
ncbi:helix-turn-helix domain-containing protein [Dactylosporangium sp. CA-233914]|uniref:helix-turn-helix domain-containing protein n=1 Tax=Dactylosporangium sp. CA-233914 TaxID=3239934 RepID=UPI003D8B928B